VLFIACVVLYELACMEIRVRQMVGDVVTMDQSCNWVHDPWLSVEALMPSIVRSKTDVDVVGAQLT
jgi:hypothetical protein